MAFDGITLRKIISEIQLLIGAKVNNIYEPDNNNIVISVYNGARYAINIETSASNYRLHLTTNIKSNPYKAPNFCMLLRKYIGNGKISKIYMNGLERICFIDFECFNEMNDIVNRTLAIELMGKYSNIVLLNDNGTIIDALKKFDGDSITSNSDNKAEVDKGQMQQSNARCIMPARKYILPEAQKVELESISEKEFVDTICSSDYKTMDTAIPNLINGISKTFMKSALDELKISNTVSDGSLKAIYQYITQILKNNCRDSKIVKYKNGYTVVRSKIVENKEGNFFLDDYYFNKQNEEEYINYRNSLLKILSATLDKIVRKLDNINEKIKSCERKEEYKIRGELLTANIYRFTNDYEKCSDSNFILITEDTKYVELENYYDNNKIIKIEIDPNITIAKNAEKYFKKYNKAKSTLEVTSAQKIDSQKELNYIESLVYELDNCNNIAEVDEVYNEISENLLFADVKLKKKNASKEKKQDIKALDNYMKLNIDGMDVFIGKNNKQNDYLSLKVANSTDYWFHTKDIHGSHLILKCNGKMPKNSTITRCAELAAYYSKAKFSSHVPVDYTMAKYVKKPKGSAPGYVIYTNNKTEYVNPKAEY